MKGIVLVVLTMICTAVVYSWSELARYETDGDAAIARRKIRSYLDEHQVVFASQHHVRATSAQRLAKATHVSGWRVAKTVLVRADDQVWMVVLPAAERIVWDRLRSALQASALELVPEREMTELFPGCEAGAEPPFGGLFDLPVLVDQAMYDAGAFVCPAGAHDESLEIPLSAYTELEHPVVAQFGAVP